MTIREIRDCLNADLEYGEECLEREVFSACGSDLMSDVLAYVGQQTLLLTGLTNAQVLRTAEITDVSAIVFVRGKKPGEELRSMARTLGIALLSTGLTMYEACGTLYLRGLHGHVSGNG